MSARDEVARLLREEERETRERVECWSPALTSIREALTQRADRFGAAAAALQAEDETTQNEVDALIGAIARKTGLHVDDETARYALGISRWARLQPPNVPDRGEEPE